MQEAKDQPKAEVGRAYRFQGPDETVVIEQVDEDFAYGRVPAEQREPGDRDGLREIPLEGGRFDANVPVRPLTGIRSVELDGCRVYGLPTEDRLEMVELCAVGIGGWSDAYAGRRIKVDPDELRVPEEGDGTDGYAIGQVLRGEMTDLELLDACLHGELG